MFPDSVSIEADDFFLFFFSKYFIKFFTMELTFFSLFKKHFHAWREKKRESRVLVFMLKVQLDVTRKRQVLMLLSDPLILKFSIVKLV